MEEIMDSINIDLEKEGMTVDNFAPQHAKSNEFNTLSKGGITYYYAI
jgi:hypothetical protein